MFTSKVVDMRQCETDLCLESLQGTRKRRQAEQRMTCPSLVIQNIDSRIVFKDYSYVMLLRNTQVFTGLKKKRATVADQHSQATPLE